MLPTEQTNILRVYHAATTAEHAAGISWYPVAHQFALDLATRYGITLERAAGIVATLSPGASWEKNQEDAETVCKAFRKRTWVSSPDFPKVGTYGEKNRVKCESIWKHGTEPSGEKVNAFWACIVHPHNETVVVVDRHALSIILCERVEARLTAKQYEQAADHYRAAAKIVGLTPAELQAVTWVVWRERSHEFVFD